MSKFEKNEENLFVTLMHHIYDGPDIEVPFLGHVHLPHLHVFGIDMSITKHVIFIWLSALLLIVALTIAARMNKKNRVPKGFGNLIEILVVFVRDEIVLPNMGPGGMKYLPYLLTTFFYIMVMNLFGLFPYGASATGNLNVTAGLAIVAFIMIQYSAIRVHGFGHYLAHLTGGVHWSLWIIMIPIEFIGLFAKPFALCVRLFANMTGGHIVILSLIGLIFVFKSLWLSPFSISFAIAINLLEIFIALLQAYVFTILTALFMGLGMETGGSKEHEH